MLTKEAGLFITNCAVCGKQAKTRFLSEKAVCKECLPDDGVSHARCHCGAIYTVEDNDITRIHGGIKSKHIDPEKICLFLINACPACDPEEKVEDIGMIFYTIT